MFTLRFLGKHPLHYAYTIFEEKRMTNSKHLSNKHQNDKKIC